MKNNQTFFKYQEITSSGYVFDPGELIQIDTEKNLDAILGVDKKSVKTIVVVGAWRGNEVASFLAHPNAIIYCFEPNETNFKHLKDRWGSNKRVICFQAACASFDGESSLNEASLTGNDSLLPIRKDSKTGLTLVKVHSIKTVKLDSVPELKGRHIDLLWADTQGYELEVLKGATELLKRTSCLFLEVYKNNMDYQGGVTYEALTLYLKEKEFYLAGEGIDKNNVGGNAIFLKNGLATHAFNLGVYDLRIRNSLKDAGRRKKMLRSKVVQKLLVLIPVRVKTLLRKILFRLS